MSTFSPNLRVELIANGDQSGTWGNTTNTNLGTILEDAISGYVTVNVTSANQAFTALNGSADEARNQVINLTTSTSANFNVYAPPAEKTYLIVNSTSYTATIYASTALNNTTAAGTGVAIPAGRKVQVYCDGINFNSQINYAIANFAVGGTLHAEENLYLSGVGEVAGSVFLGVSQPVTISVASPAVITPGSTLPFDATAIRFTTSGELPAPLNTTTTYYVINRNTALGTFNVSLSPGSPPIVTTTTSGSGTFAITTVSTATTAPAGTNNSQIATTAFVASALSNLALTNWALTETNATQAATINIASPALVSVATAPANGTAVSFSTTGALPTGITANAAYYVINRTGTTYNLATTAGGTAINTTGTQSGAHTETTSKLNFAYKSQNRMSIDLGGNIVSTGNVTAYGTV